MAASNKGNWAPKQINRLPPGERLQLKRDFLGNATRAPAKAPNRTQHVAELSVTTGGRAPKMAVPMRT